MTDDVSVAGIEVTPVAGRYVVPTSPSAGPTPSPPSSPPSATGAGWSPPAGPTSRPRPTARGVPGGRVLAAAAAALSQGLPATVTGTGVRVAAVRPGSPAAGVLRPGDVILAVDAAPSARPPCWRRSSAPAPPGTLFTLSVERDGRVRGDPRHPRRPGGLGLTVETRDLAVELPFEVRFEGRAGGGPGAGLAYALAIADLLSPATWPRAAPSPPPAPSTPTATSPVRRRPGDPAALAEAAAQAGAAVLVVPGEQADGARRDGLRVQGVESLARALEALSTTV